MRRSTRTKWGPQLLPPKECTLFAGFCNRKELEDMQRFIRENKHTLGGYVDTQSKIQYSLGLRVFMWSCGCLVGLPGSPFGGFSLNVIHLHVMEL